jgi:hypothetical protein
MDLVYDIWKSTISYGSIHATNDDIRDEGIEDLPELYLHAIARDIDISLNVKDICEKIKEQIPSKEWQIKNLLTMSNRDLVSEESLKQVSDYGSYSFENMNISLREGWTNESPINDTISKMEPLDKDIIVFRYLRRYKFLPTIPGSIFDSKGYLSTTMDPLLASNAVCNSIIPFDANYGAIMKIKIPAGKKAIYLPGREKELLLPHDIKLLLTGFSKKKYVCPSKDRKTCYIMDNMPVFEFTMM